MKISRLMLPLAVMLAALLPAATGLAQSGPPPIPVIWLDSYSFQQTNFDSDMGYAPLNSTNVVNVDDCWGNAVMLDTTNLQPAFLQYNIVETNGFVNLDLGAGAVFAAVTPDWASADTNQNGQGPGELGYLLAACDFSSGSPQGLWAIYVDAGGTNIYFGGVSNSVVTTYVCAPISWASNSYHEIAVTYSTNSMLYLDGQWAATGGPVTVVPASTNAFYVGSDNSGFEQFRGEFLYLEFDTTNLLTYIGSNWFIEDWAWDTNSYYTWLNPSVAGFQTDLSSSSSFQLPPTPTNAFNSNYLAYTNFWMSITNTGTEAQVRLINPCLGLTYVILTNTTLAPLSSTNWQPWITLTGSGTVMATRPLKPASNTLYFCASLVWSTCTAYTNPLPDWWAMLYFNSTACVNPAGNPSGDGIDNWDKYVMGLNPNIAYTSPLLITPPGGNYVATPSIDIFSLSGSQIKYTTDDSTPSATNGISVSSGIPLTNLPSGNFTLKAWENGLASNAPITATYNIIPSTPVFSLASGVYRCGTTLQISPVTSNAVVRYTTNGVDPTTSSSQIWPTNAITLTTNMTIKAAAWLNGVESPEANATFVIQGVSTPPINDNFSNAITLVGASGEVTGTALNATVESFETNWLDSSYDYTAAVIGNSVWYKWVAPSNGTLYINSFDYDYLFYLGAWAFPPGSGSNPTNLVPVGLGYGNFGGNWVNGVEYYTMPVTNYATYYICASYLYQYGSADSGPFQFSWQYVGPTTEPVFRPDANTSLSAELVTVFDNDTNAVMRYTLDGTDPTTNSPVIASGSNLSIGRTTTLKAAAWRTALEESAIKTAVYTINPSATNPTQTASAPTISPTNGPFASSLTITLTCTNSGSVIYYTLDGTTPSAASASVSSGGTVTLTNSAIVNATAWVTNMNLSPVTTGLFPKAGVDTAGDGIPDTAKFQIGANFLIADAEAANGNPFAHGLDNMQVYQNPSVLLANNYSTLNDGIPDWWLVQNGYSVTTPATALGANGQTLLASYLAGLYANNPISQGGYLPLIDFHIAHGPANSLVMVLDNVRPDMASYFLFCTDEDSGSPLYNQTVLQQFPANTAMPIAGKAWGRYFQLTNPLPSGNWLFTLQGVNSNGLWSANSTNTFGLNLENFPGDGTESDGWYMQTGKPIPVVGYTNHNGTREADLAQILRAESDVWIYNGGYPDVMGPLFGGKPFVYDYGLPQSVITQAYWGTLTFQITWRSAGYATGIAVGFASNYTSICATPDAARNCETYYPYGNFPWTLLNPLQCGDDTNGNPVFYMPDETWGGDYCFNPAGLQYLSATYTAANQAPATLYPGQTGSVPGSDFTFDAALETETPTLQTINYYFDGRDYPVFTGGGSSYRSLPPSHQWQPYCYWKGWTTFQDGWASDGVDYGIGIAVSITNPVIVAQVGRTVNLQSWSEVWPVRPDGTVLTNQSYWLDQDFAQAYLCDPATGDVQRTNQPNWNGQMKIDTNNATTTGILSPNLNYPNTGQFATRGANFTPTQPGKVIVTTQPDPNGNYGEVTIYVIDMQADANHDGVMDNRDLTSVDNPMQFWANNDYDRLTPDSDDGVSYDDSVLTAPTTDGYYFDNSGPPAIPTMRDLEDYFRLWTPGLSNVMASLPTNYSVTFQWRNNTGAGVRLFRAAETNGGTNYLSDQATAIAQTNFSLNPCYGYVLPNQPLDLGTEFRTWTLAPPPNSDHFIFCGTATGNDELVCQVRNPYGGVVGEASVFLNIKDIKQMYERWSVGEYPASPNNIATNCGDDGSPSFQYPYDPSVNATTPYILYVHGWNMETWEKDRFAESAFKRLYWQGYQGRFGLFRWPTDNDFGGTLIDAILQPHNYDSSEYTAWHSANGLMNKLIALNIQYPSRAYMLAHSMGNVVAGEALRLAAQQGTGQIVNTYVGSQAAIPAHVYDATVTSPYLIDYTHVAHFDPAPGHPNTPNIYGNRLTNNAPAVGRKVSFYNVNDYALNADAWCFDQEHKPDTFVGSGYYFYSGSTNDPLPWNNFEYVYSAGGSSSIDIVTNLDGRYQVLGYAANPYSTALGATPIGTFAIVNLTRSLNPVWPWPDPLNNSYKAHYWHSAQFRGDNWQQQGYWNELLGTEAFGLK